MEHWDLSKIFPSIDDAKKALEDLHEKCMFFKLTYRKEMAFLNDEELKECLEYYAEIRALVCKIDSFAYLLYSTDLNNQEICSFYQNCQEAITECLKKIKFFGIEIVSVSDKIKSLTKKNLFTAGELAWLKAIIKEKPYILEEKQEQLFSEMSTIENAWIRLYDTTRSKMLFKMDGQTYSEGGLLLLQSSKHPEVRRKAGKMYVEAYEKNTELFTMIYNNLLKSRSIYTSWHNYRYPAHQANIENDIKRSDLINLVNTVVNNREISHRYYALKAKLIGLKRLTYWDRNAPYSISVKKKEYSIEEAKELILKAFEKFSPEFAQIAKTFFDDNLIDYYPYEGKDSGAYCMEMPVGYPSYVFLNFNGTPSSVMVMAHELGHAVHETLSKEQGELGRRHSCAQAETASVFAEKLVFNALYENAQTPEEKFILLASHVEEMIMTSFRQIAFHRFEEKAANKRKNGEISSKELSRIWRRFMGEYLGNAVDISDLNNIWCSTPHFFHYSFYVYSYCFSQCVVNTLYSLYLNGNISDFPEKYMNMLKMGGVENYQEALARFGIDAKSKDFWQQGINLIEEYVTELEKLANEINIG